MKNNRTSKPALILIGVIAVVPALFLRAYAGLVDPSNLTEKTRSGIVRCPSCDPQDAIDLGMVETGTSPVFPPNFTCRGIDDGWAIDYSTKRAKTAFHGGIDIPAPRGTPILAIADGTVVAMFDNRETAVGVRIFVQHPPESTGKPFWAYSEYAHLLELPALAIGDQVKRGDIVGLTSNTGISGAEARSKRGGGGGPHGDSGRVRRDALHFSILYSDGPDYAILMRGGGHLVPVGGQWMDPVSFYQPSGPFHPKDVANLSEDRKRINIPVSMTAGSVTPNESKVIWPYPCTPDR